MEGIDTDTHPVLTTERLRLRAFEPADAPAVKQLAGDRAIAATTQNIPHPYEEGMAEEWIASRQPAFESGESVSFAITAVDSSELLGAIGIYPHPADERAEIGYWIGKPFWNRGYATEAGEAVVAYGFDQLGLQRIMARHYSSNPSSGRVMEKLGMRLEGRMRQHIQKWGVLEDVLIYGILRTEYETQRDALPPSGDRILNESAARDRSTVFRELNPVIPVRDMPAAVAFYEEELGFTKVFDDAPSPGDPIRYAGVARANLCLHLQTMAPDENPTMPLIRIRVESIEPLYEEYRDRGLIGPGGELEAKPWGSKDFGVYDLNRAALVFYEDL